MSTDLRLRPIADLLDERFFVPSYQRGYRWTPTQINALLDDLDAFRRTTMGQPDAYYCLQPVVVCKRPDGEWELIDGQQRLTTIFLILRYLDDIVQSMGKSAYTVRYETRPLSEAYLMAPSEELAESNIDFHHMWRAREAIAQWFEVHDGTLKWPLVSCLLADSTSGLPNVRVIWYELGQEQDPRNAFIRLNVGRIPLTSAELIRAIFLRADNDDDETLRRRDQIAREWDGIEARLQHPELWGFLHREANTPPARIEFLFELFVRSRVPNADHRDELWIYFAFQAWIDDQGCTSWDAWLRFRKETVAVLDEWYEDFELYHLVGGLIAVAPKEKGSAAKVLVELLAQREGLTGTAFDRLLRQRAWRRLIGGTRVALPQNSQDLEIRLVEHLEQVHYGQPILVRTALLLFNVAGMLAHKAPTQRFRFDGFKGNRWDIEHIRSVTEYIPAGARARLDWLTHARDFVTSPAGQARDSEGWQALCRRIDALLGQKSPEKVAFAKVFADVRALSGEGEAQGSDHSLSNLCLLDMGTNRSYQNAIFPVKRRRIIALDTEGVYVPPGTRHVFHKYFNPNAAQLLLWDQTDQEAYAAALRDGLLGFFAPLGA